MRGIAHVVVYRLVSVVWRTIQSFHARKWILFVQPISFVFLNDAYRCCFLWSLTGQPALVKHRPKLF